MADGKIEIEITVDDKPVTSARKALQHLEEAGVQSGKGLKAAENSMDSLSDKSAKAGSSMQGTKGAIDSLGDHSSDAAKSIQGTKNVIDGLGDSGPKVGKELKGVDDAVGGLSDHSGQASKSVKGVSDSLATMTEEASLAVKSVKDIQTEAQNVEKKTGKAEVGFKNLATSLGLVSVASSAFDALKSSIGDAIDRFDTLNKFPKVLQSLGVSAEASQASMEKLSDGIDGLPTTLNDIAGSAQRMYTSFGDMDQATNTAIALNNALLGSGSSAEEAKRGTEQYTKALQTGEINMDTWNTLSVTMDTGLVKVAESMGYAGKTAKDDLYKALKDGTVSLDTFNDNLIKVGTGSGIMAEMAKENSLGIATSFTNLKNTATKGIANILDALDKLSVASTGKSIAQNIDGLKSKLNKAFSIICKAILLATPLLSGLYRAFDTLTPVIFGVVAAVAALGVLKKINGYYKTAKGLIDAYKSSQKALKVVSEAQLALVATKLKLEKGEVALLAANAGALSLKTIAVGLLTGQISLATGATIIWTKASIACKDALNLMKGPIGWVTAVIGVLVGITIGLVKWFNRGSEAGEEMQKKTDDLSKSTKNTTDSIKKSVKAYADQKKSINDSATANKKLAGEIITLAGKERLSATEKLKLNTQIQALNGNIKNLGLAYDEEAGKLSMSNEQLQKRVEYYKNQSLANSAQERLNQLLTEQNDTEQKLNETQRIKAEWDKKKESGIVTTREYNKAINQLNEDEQKLTAAKSMQSEKYKVVEQQQIEAQKKVDEAIKTGVALQVSTIEELPEKMQPVVQKMKDQYAIIKDAATNTAETINTKSELSNRQMLDNLGKNTDAVAEWGKNLKSLTARGLDEGLIQQLQAAGPAAAGKVKEMANMTAAELEEYNQKMRKAGEVGYNALADSSGMGRDKVYASLKDLITGVAPTLQQEMDKAGFDKVGKNIADATADGILNNKKASTDAAATMATDTSNAFKFACQIQSPSKVFMSHGQNLVDGLVQGITTGQNKVTQAISQMFKVIQTGSSNSFREITKGYKTSVAQIDKSLQQLPKVTKRSMDAALKQLKDGSNPQVDQMQSLAKALLKPYDSTPGKMASIGQNLMAGLKAGLLNGQGSVMDTARNIAHDVAQTMKDSLKIKSPSQVTNEIGQNTGSGMAQGMEQSIPDISRISEKMADTAMPKIKALVNKYRNMSPPVGDLSPIRSVRPSNYTSSASRGQDKQLKETQNLLGEAVNLLKEIKEKDTSVYLDRQKVGQSIQPVTDRLSGEQVRLRERWSL